MKRLLARIWRHLITVPKGDGNSLDKYWHHAPNGVLYLNSLEMIQDGRYDRQLKAARQLAKNTHLSRYDGPA